MGQRESKMEGVDRLMEFVDLAFFQGKRVFVTGHTGFKGTWLCRILKNLGAVVTGYGLEPQTQPNLFSLAGLEGTMDSRIGDVRDFDALFQAFENARPEIVLHLAAQPIVRESYRNPVYTYETNVMGTVHILECIRRSSSVRSFLNVTTDKVYFNREWTWGYRENEALDGFDPYSNSKSCSELVTHSYKNSFFSKGEVAVSTARAGNVIGGGDFSPDRIVPDCVRAAWRGEPIIVRNPSSTRPYQHVLEPLFAYLMIAEKQYKDGKYAGWYNVGPDDCDCVTTGKLVDLFCHEWGRRLTWEDQAEPDAPHEANFLKLDCSQLKATFHWHPCWGIREALQQTCRWTEVYFRKGNIPEEMDREIQEFLRSQSSDI